MKFSKFFIILSIGISIVLMSFGTISKKIKKKVDKEIKMAFTIETFELQSIEVSEAINTTIPTKIKENSLFKISSNGKVLGYAFVDKAPSKTDEFDYLVLFDDNLIIKKTKVLIYREDYGGEIGSKRWLKQFRGKTTSDKLTYQKDIIAISGATISANSMTVAVNNLLQSIAVLHKQNII